MIEGFRDMSLYGMSVYQSTFALQKKQFRFPRCKSKRIRKKWAKVPHNFRDVPGAYIMGNRCVELSTDY